MKELIFYYDVVCPFAYVASRVIERMAKRLGAKIVWKPVLLGGLYKGTKGDSLSPILDQSAPAKLKIIGEDLQRTMYRNNVKSNSPSQFPRDSLNCMRLLAAASQYSPKTCIDLTHSLYTDFWINDKDIAQLEVLENAASSVGWKVDVSQAISGIGKEVLWTNVKEALDRGAFGVPSFWVNNHLYYGVDRLHFVERELGNLAAVPSRLASPSPSPRKPKLTIFYDFASPWAYLGSTQIPKLLASVSPVQVEVEWVPILVGVLFKSIGTPMIPMQHISEAKRNYGMQDLKDWTKYHGIQFEWTTHFPLKSVLSSRICLVDGDDRLRQTIYDAAWRDNIDIGDKDVLREVLSKAGFDADGLIKETQRQDIKDMLRTNTQRAIDSGVCGVPSYQVNDGAILWGQDRLNVVADLLCGWQDYTETTNILTSSKL